MYLEYKYNNILYNKRTTLNIDVQKIQLIKVSNIPTNK